MCVTSSCTARLSQLGSGQPPTHQVLLLRVRLGSLLGIVAHVVLELAGHCGFVVGGDCRIARVPILL